MADKAGIFLHQLLLKIDIPTHREVLILSELTVRMTITPQVWMNADLEMEKYLLNTLILNHMYITITRKGWCPRTGEGQRLMGM